MNHDQILRKRAGATQATIVARILRSWDKANSSDIEAGARWYDEAGQLASDFATVSGHGRDVCAAVIAHLSPRQSWARNILAARALLVDGEVLPGVMSRETNRAWGAINDGYDDIFDSFSPDAHKTRAFCANILGDREAVTVDVWACKVAGITDLELGRVGVYDAVAHAYRLAARRRGVDPATMQATTWIVARNGRAS
jgi:hypothetical protein